MRTSLRTFASVAPKHPLLSRTNGSSPWQQKRLIAATYPRPDRSHTDQVHPIQGYYADLLDAPLHSVQNATKTDPKPPPKEDPPLTEKEETLTKARVIFGSRLAGPAERRHEIEKLSQNIAGIMVPPRPEEPDNCCMSGCVNCVWDLYRDELEEWAAKRTEARKRIINQRVQGTATGTMSQEAGTPSHTVVSMDDDGGGSEANWSDASGLDSLDDPGQDLFADIPVGIREFMKTEKRLKERHKRQKLISG